MDGNKLSVVNEHDEVIGEELREVIHRDGLLHREIHVWFITPEREVVLQHRAPTKDTYPDLLDATVGGHVEIGDGYLTAAIQETREETGLEVSGPELVEVCKIHGTSHDEVTGLTNSAIRQQYVYLFEGSVDDLEVEEGKAVGFEVWPIAQLWEMSEEERAPFMPMIFRDQTRAMLEDGQRLLGLV